MTMLTSRCARREMSLVVPTLFANAMGKGGIGDCRVGRRRFRSCSRRLGPRLSPFPSRRLFCRNVHSSVTFVQRNKPKPKSTSLNAFVFATHSYLVTYAGLLRRLRTLISEDMEMQAGSSHPNTYFKILFHQKDLKNWGRLKKFNTPLLSIVRAGVNTNILTSENKIICKI